MHAGAIKDFLTDLDLVLGVSTWKRTRSKPPSQAPPPQGAISRGVSDTGLLEYVLMGTEAAGLHMPRQTGSNWIHRLIAR